MNQGLYQLFAKGADNSLVLVASSGNLETQAHLDAWSMNQTQENPLTEGQAWHMVHETHPDYVAVASKGATGPGPGKTISGQAPPVLPATQTSLNLTPVESDHNPNAGRTVPKINLGAQVTNFAQVQKFEREHAKKRYEAEFEKTKALRDHLSEFGKAPRTVKA